jgi:hypothetical protein
MKINAYSSLSKVFLAGVAAGLLSGCSANFVPSAVTPERVPIGNIQGIVHGGQAPVSGGHVYLYAAGTGGYGTSATSLIKSGNNAFEDGSGNYYVVTDGNGNFSLGGDYTCTEGTQVYAVAVGGNPGLNGNTTATFSTNHNTITVANPAIVDVGATITGSGVGGTVTGVSGTTVTLSQNTTSSGTNAAVVFSVSNSAIVQMAGLAQCPTAGNLAAQVPYLVINEVTTVAFAYSMGGFGTNAYNISSNAPTTTSPGAIAIANAMTNAGNIVNLQYGQAPTAVNGRPNNSVNPQTTIYALANILATCVNVSGPAQPACTALFNASKNSAGTAPTDEATAIFNIVHNPGQNVSTLFGIMPQQGVFSPALTKTPNDWTVPVVYTNAISVYKTNGTTIISGSFNEAADTNGNIWVGDEGQGVVEIGPQGASSVYNTNANGDAFNEIKGVAVSPAGTIWASDAGANQMNILDSSGNPKFTSAAKAAGIDGPAGIAFDTTGNAWVANDSSTSASWFTSTGANGATKAISFGTNMSGPAWIAVDSSNNIFSPSQNSTYVGSLAAGNTAGSENSISAAYALAVDSSDNIWMPNSSAGAPWSLYELSCPVTTNRNGKKSISCSTTTSKSNQGGMNIPDRISLDGGGMLWIANQGATTVSAYNINTGKWLATAGLSNGRTCTTNCNALDAIPDISGNVWVSNQDGSVTELLGVATPTAEPLIPGNYGQKP